MIGQYLSNTNESATVSISQKFSELNKALLKDLWSHCVHTITQQTCLGLRVFNLTVIFSLLYHRESSRGMTIHVGR